MPIFQISLVIVTIIAGIFYGPQFLTWVYNENAATGWDRPEGSREYAYRGKIRT